MHGHDQSDDSAEDDSFVSSAASQHASDDEDENTNESDDYAKEEDAKKLGADHFIYSGDKAWAKPYAFKFDFILNCKLFISQCSNGITY